MSKKGPVIILGALDGEISAFLQFFTLNEPLKWKEFVFYSGVYSDKEIIVAKCGVGKVLSAMVTQKIIDLYDPSAIIFTGIAGSLNHDLEIGDILVGEDSIQHDVDATRFNFKRGEIPHTPYRFLKSDPALMGSALSFKSEKHKIYKGRMLTGDQFISYKNFNEKPYLIDELAGDCVEMEGGSVALVATVNDIPHILIRTISDKAHIKTKLNLREFLKVASENSLEMVKHILNNI